MGLQGSGCAAAVGQQIRQWRARGALNQFELAARAAISTRHLSFLETGRARASVAVIDRLCGALGLSGAEADRLRLAAGYAPASGTAEAPADITATVFSAAIALDSAGDARTMAQHARPALAALGMQQFFFGRIEAQGRHRRMRWTDLGAFPRGWLHRYDAEEYGRDDPLLDVAERHNRAFFWSEAVERPALARRARRMFDEAAGAGIVSGFVVPLHRADGTVDFVSMMGALPERREPEVRLGLQTIGLQMLFRMQWNGMAAGGLPAR